jgi:activator of HSP90 ATPase
MKKTIKKVYKIRSSIEDVWKALVDQSVIDRWGGGPSKMTESVDTDFELWNGDIYGRNIKVVHEAQLVQEWFGGDWAKPSIVTFSLKKEDPYIILKLEQINVPFEELEDIDAGWDDFFLGPMKKMLESDQFETDSNTF